MAVNNNQSKFSYNGNGTTGPWNYPRYFIQNSDLLVVKTNTSGVDIPLSFPADYSVTGAGNPSGGSITTTAAVVVGETITVAGNVDYIQPDEYPETGNLPAKTIERGLDRQTMMIQQIKEIVGRCLRFRISSTVTEFNVDTPVANAALVYNEDGDGVTNGPTVAQITNASADAAAAASSAAAAAASAATIGDFDLSGTPAANDALLWDTGTSKFIRRTVEQLRSAVLPWIPSASTVAAYLDFHEATNNGTNRVRLSANNTLPADLAVFLPTRNGTLSTGVTPAQFGAVGDGVANDTNALRDMLNACALYDTINLEGKTYRVTGLITVPNTADRLTMQDGAFTVSGDVSLIRAGTGGTLNFFTMRNILITATAQTTVGRAVIDFTNMSQCLFENVHILGTTGVSHLWGSSASGTGQSPYYNLWLNCYGGGMRIGINFTGGGGAALGANSNRVLGVRLQPGAGNFGVYCDNHSQNNTIHGYFESVGGTGVYLDGVGNVVEDGCRFESLTTGISVNGTATGCYVGRQYFSSNGTNISFAGNSRTANLYIEDLVAFGGRGSAQLDRTSTVAFAAQTGATALLYAGGIYQIEIEVDITCGAVGGFALLTTGTAGFTSYRLRAEAVTGGVVPALSNIQTVSGNVIMSTAGQTAYRVRISGTVEVSTSGTINLHGAQSASNATTTSFLVGSVISAKRLN